MARDLRLILLVFVSLLLFLVFSAPVTLPEEDVVALSRSSISCGPGECSPEQLQELRDAASRLREDPDAESNVTPDQLDTIVRCAEGNCSEEEMNDLMDDLTHGGRLSIAWKLLPSWSRIWFDYDFGYLNGDEPTPARSARPDRPTAPSSRTSGPSGPAPAVPTANKSGRG